MKNVFTSLFIFTLSAANRFSQETLVKNHFNLQNGLVIQGYDPVAYFKQSKAVKGKKDFATFYQGATYYFVSAENKELLLGTISFNFLTWLCRIY